jgi:hypothetical protein
MEYCVSESDAAVGCGRSQGGVLLGGKVFVVWLVVSRGVLSELPQVVKWVTVTGSNLKAGDCVVKISEGLWHEMQIRLMMSSKPLTMFLEPWVMRCNMTQLGEDVAEGQQLDIGDDIGCL